MTHVKKRGRGSGVRVMAYTPETGTTPLNPVNTIRIMEVLRNQIIFDTLNAIPARVSVHVFIQSSMHIISIIIGLIIC